MKTTVVGEQKSAVKTSPRWGLVVLQCIHLHVHHPWISYLQYKLMLSLFKITGNMEDPRTVELLVVGMLFLCTHTLGGVGWEPPPRGQHWDLLCAQLVHAMLCSVSYSAQICLRWVLLKISLLLWMLNQMREQRLQRREERSTRLRIRDRTKRASQTAKQRQASLQCRRHRLSRQKR